MFECFCLISSHGVVETCNCSRSFHMCCSPLQERVIHSLLHAGQATAQSSHSAAVPAAEVYPSSVRSTAHGMSAAVGKLGALAPTIFFNYIGNRAKFWAVCWAGLLGFLMTVIFVPDATGTHSRHSHAPLSSPGLSFAPCFVCSAMDRFGY